MTDLTTYRQDILPSSATQLLSIFSKTYVSAEYTARQLFIITETNIKHTLQPEEILGISLVGGNASIYESNAGGRAGAAALGGVTFGGIGAILGALLVNPETKIGPIEVRLRYLKHAKPHKVSISFLDASVDVRYAREHMLKAQALVESIEDWLRYSSTRS